MKELTGRLRAGLTGLAWIAALGAPLWFAAASLGSKFDVIDWTFGLGVMVFGWGAPILIATGVIGAAALVLSGVYRIAYGRMRGGWISPVLALAVALSGIWYANSVRQTAAELPFIHDVTTDFENPPGFSRALIERRNQIARVNTLEYEGKIDCPPSEGRPNCTGRLVSELQAEAYPDIGPILLITSPEIAFEAALGVARDMGWRVPTASRESGIFEATHETFWFGFEDDVSVRITPREGGGSRVDIRSVSRVGGSDLGKNAQRVREFERRLRRSVGEQESRA